MLRHEVCLCASHQYVSLRWEVAAFTRKVRAEPQSGPVPRCAARHQPCLSPWEWEQD